MAKKPTRKQAAEDPSVPAKTLPLERYRVSLECPTPLGHNPCEVEATSEQGAKQRFLLANGISDSEWPFTIEKL